MDWKGGGDVSIIVRIIPDLYVYRSAGISPIQSRVTRSLIAFGSRIVPIYI